MSLLHAALGILLDSDVIFRDRTIMECHKFGGKCPDYKALLQNYMKVIRDNDGKCKLFLKSVHIELDETYWTNYHEVTQCFMSNDHEF